MQIFSFSYRRRKGSYSWRKRRHFHRSEYFVYPKGNRTYVVHHERVKENAYGNGKKTTS